MTYGAFEVGDRVKYADGRRGEIIAAYPTFTRQKVGYFEYEILFDKGTARRCVGYALTLEVPLEALADVLNQTNISER